MKQEEPKKETLEEAAKIHLNSGKIPNDYQSFIQGAKWQAERIYSEEEVKHLIHQACYFSGVRVFQKFDKWFSQFKKQKDEKHTRITNR
jgi:hypothetical protein